MSNHNLISSRFTNKIFTIAMALLSQDLCAAGRALMCEHVLTPETGTLVREDVAANRSYFLLGEGRFESSYRVVERSSGQNLAMVKVYNKAAVLQEGRDGLIYGGFSAANVARADADNLEFLAKVTDSRIDTFRILKVQNRFSDERPHGPSDEGSPTVEYELIEGQSLQALLDNQFIASAFRATLLRKYKRYLERLNGLLSKNYSSVIAESRLAEIPEGGKIAGVYKTSLLVEFSKTKKSSYPGVNGLNISVSNIVVTPDLQFYLIAPN